jgi:DNA-directed RNA polymerase subunit alpha
MVLSILKKHSRNLQKSLIQHFMLFSDQTMVLDSTGVSEPEPIDEEFLHMRKLLKTPLSDLDLSVSAFNCLKAADVKTLGRPCQIGNF